MHKFSVPSKAVIESISMSSAGDIRGAINALQFACLKGKNDSKCFVATIFPIYCTIIKETVNIYKGFINDTANLQFICNTPYSICEWSVKK